MKLGKLTYFFSIIAILGILFSGCEKSLDDQRQIGASSVSIKEVYFEEDNSDMDANSSDEEFGYKSQVKKLGLIAFSHGRNIEVSLESDEPDPSAPRKIYASNGKTPSNQKAAIERNLLTTGTRYILYVYDNQGNYVAERTYKYRSENNTAALMLDGGVTYTFIAVSINHSTNLPTVIDKQRLSTVKVSNCADDLMVFKKELKLVEGNNYLDVILKHRYSAIITKLSIDPNTTGNLTVLQNVKVAPTVASASMSLGSEAIEYHNAITNGSTITFPSIGTGVRTITSNQKLIINQETNTGTLTFGKITIDGDTKENLVISNIKIKPGVKYKLHLNFRTCTQNVTSERLLDWHHPEVIKNGKKGIEIGTTFYPNGSTISKTIDAPSADYGFVFDMTELDNTFNMTINGDKLATREVQFQSNAMTTQNIKFADGSMYEGNNVEGGTIGAVYDMVGTANRPVVKVVISRTGQVTMYGSKKSGGILYPLVLFNGTSFNNVTWNRNSDNTVKITQVIDGRTIMKGDGSGKKKIACPN